MEFDRVKFAGLRITRKLTQGQLAEKLEVSRPTIAGWEQGTIIPKLPQINDAAKFFGVEPEELVIKGVKA